MIQLSTTIYYKLKFEFDKYLLFRPLSFLDLSLILLDPRPPLSDLFN